MTTLFALCGEAATESHRLIGNAAIGPLALFIAGLAGSTVHCGPMCGPFVLGQAGEKLRRVPAHLLCERHRISAALLPAYHAGRITTYAALGAAVAWGGARLTHLPWFDRASGILLIAASLGFLLMALARLVPRRVPAMPVPRTWAGGLAAISARIDRAHWYGSYALGLVLGFLPCGFLYAGLAIAASTGRPLQGALLMAAFGLGTVPSLILVGIAGMASHLMSKTVTSFAAPLILAANAVVLAAAGWHSLLRP